MRPEEKKKSFWGAGGMAQELRILSSLPEVLGLILSTHTVAQGISFSQDKEEQLWDLA